MACEWRRNRKEMPKKLTPTEEAFRKVRLELRRRDERRDMLLLAHSQAAIRKKFENRPLPVTSFGKRVSMSGLLRINRKLTKEGGAPTLGDIMKRAAVLQRKIAERKKKNPPPLSK